MRGVAEPEELARLGGSGWRAPFWRQRFSAAESLTRGPYIVGAQACAVTAEVGLAEARGTTSALQRRRRTRARHHERPSRARPPPAPPARLRVAHHERLSLPPGPPANHRRHALPVSATTVASYSRAHSPPAH